MVCAVAICTHHAKVELLTKFVVRDMNSGSCMATSVAFDPGEECCLVDQHATANAAHDLVKAVGTFKEDQVAQPTDGRPGMVLVPVGQRDEPGGRYAGGRCAGLRGGIVGLGSLLRTRGTAWLGLGLVSSRTRKEKSHEAFLYIGGLLVTPVVVPKWA